MAVGHIPDPVATGRAHQSIRGHYLSGCCLVDSVETTTSISGNPELTVYGWGWPPNYQYVLPAQCEEGKEYWVAASQEGDGW